MACMEPSKLHSRIISSMPKIGGEIAFKLENSKIGILHQQLDWFRPREIGDLFDIKVNNWELTKKFII